jgi:tRNA(Ile)-lysidine synthase
MIVDKVKDTVRKYGLLNKNDRVVVGVSGGPDSVALLYILAGLKKELGLKLHVAHLDHSLRPDSAKDAAFVKNLARKLGLPLTKAKIQRRKLTGRGSPEENARNARFDFFFRIARGIKADKIALGHNLDDQAETVLMRILRGAGLSGLAGILPKRQICGFWIIRPLIEVRRKEIEAYLRHRRIWPRIDSSNKEDIYLRNRIRNKLLPLLEKEYNSNIREVLSNTGESVGYDYDYLNRKAASLAARSGRRIDLVKLLRLHPSLRRLLLRLSIARLKGDTRRITFRHIREIEDLIVSRPLNSVVDLPKGISVVKKKKALVFLSKPSRR